LSAAEAVIGAEANPAAINAIVTKAMRRVSFMQISSFLTSFA
jgi:hypothetical protein